MNKELAGENLLYFKTIPFSKDPSKISFLLKFYLNVFFIFWISVDKVDRTKCFI